MKRTYAVLLSMVLLLSVIFIPDATFAEETLLGASVLNIRVDAAVVEVFDTPGEEPSFIYEPSRYTVIREMTGDTLSITIEPRRKYLHGGDTMKVYLPMSDYSAIHVEANASDFTLPPFNADFDAVVNASAFTCYLPGGFSHDLRIEANASAVETYLHNTFQDFTILTDDTVSAISLPNGMASGDRLGEGAHTLAFQAIASSVDVSWYTDATPIPYEQPPETSIPAGDSEDATSLSLDISIPSLSANEEVYLGSLTLPFGSDVEYTLSSKGGKGIAIGMTRSEDVSLLSAPTRYLMAQTQDGKIHTTFYADDIEAREGQTMHVWVSSLGDTFKNIMGTVVVKPGIPGRTTFPR